MECPRGGEGREDAPPRRQRGDEPPLRSMNATALIANPGDRWRKKLAALLGVPDSTSDAWLFFLAHARIAGGPTKMISARGPDDPWRSGICGALRLPMNTDEKTLRRAILAYQEERQHGGFGYEPLPNSAAGGGPLVK